MLGEGVTPSPLPTTTSGWGPLGVADDGLTSDRDRSGRRGIVVRPISSEFALVAGKIVDRPGRIPRAEAVTSDEVEGDVVFSRNPLALDEPATGRRTVSVRPSGASSSWRPPKGLVPGTSRNLT